MGAGSSGRGLSAGNGLDVANLMKPPLARGELQVIGATTLDEFRKYLEKDAALERRFQPVLIGEASPEQALAILSSLQVHPLLHYPAVVLVGFGLGWLLFMSTTMPEE